jgi:hypothetical protein
VILFSLFLVVHVNVTILAHSSSVKFIMRTIPGFFCSAVFVVAVIAKALRIVGFIIMSTFDKFFSIIMDKNTFSFLSYYFSSDPN